MPPESPADSKTFWEHLFVVKRYLTISLVSVIVFAVIAHRYYGDIIKLIFLPLHGKQLVFLSVTDPIFFIFKVDLFAGFFVSLPLISWLAFRFVSPAFSAEAKSRIVLYCSMSVALALAALAYAYFVTVPLCIKFLFSITVSGVSSMVTAQSYINFFLVQAIVNALVFQIPLVMIVATRWGFLKPDAVAKKRGWVYMATVIGIGFFVPPDFFSLLITIIPALLAFEATLIICRYIHRKSSADAAHE